MLKTKAYIYDLLSTDTTLLYLVGSSDNIVDAWPETVTLFPLVICQDENQDDWEYADNAPKGANVSVRIDVFTKIGGTYPTSTSIGYEVDRIMKSEFFRCNSNGEVADDTEGVRHRVMRYSRAMFSTNL